MAQDKALIHRSLSTSRKALARSRYKESPQNSAAFTKWCYKTPPALYYEKKLSPEIVGVSKDFVNSIKEVFKTLYEEVYEKEIVRSDGFRRDLCCNDGNLYLADTKSYKEVTIRNTRRFVAELEDWIDELCSSQIHPDEDLPTVVTMFKELCKLVKDHRRSKWQTRTLLYFVFNNPILYKDGQSIVFLMKSYNLYLMAKGMFSADSNCEKLMKQLKSLNSNSPEIVYKCMYFKSPVKEKQLTAALESDVEEGSSGSNEEQEGDEENLNLSGKKRKRGGQKKEKPPPSILSDDGSSLPALICQFVEARTREESI